MVWKMAVRLLVQGKRYLPTTTADGEESAKSGHQEVGGSDRSEGIRILLSICILCKIASLRISKVGSLYSCEQWSPAPV